jgi:hypothetical protein
MPALDWDDANSAHVARHGVAPAEAEQVVLGASLPLDTEERSGEDRHTELGETTAGAAAVGRLDLEAAKDSRGDSLPRESEMAHHVEAHQGGERCLARNWPR